MFGFIILHYGNRTVTEKCVNSILKLDRAEECFVLIVDNDPKMTEGLFPDHDNIKVIHIETGFSMANNTGFYNLKKMKDCDFIVVANNDIVFSQKDYLDLVESSYKRNKWDVLSHDIVSENNGSHQSPMDTKRRTRLGLFKTIFFNKVCFKLYPLIKKQLKNFVKNEPRNFIDHEMKDVVPNGACIVLSERFIKSERYIFYPETDFYYEEYILHEKCRRKGYSIFYDPKISVMHYDGCATKKRTGDDIIKFRLKNIAKSAAIYRDYLNSDDDKGSRKKMLYIMPVDWGWIAQRPHFMAITLGKYYDVKVLYPKFLYKTWKNQQNVQPPRDTHGVIQIPFQERNPVLQYISNWIFRLYAGNIKDYDIIWLGTPMFTRLIPKNYKGIVVYDYMDNVAALQSNDKVAEYVKKAHKELLKRADIIFATSRYLMDGIKQYKHKTDLLRNALVPAPQKQGLSKNIKKFNIGYVGTVSAWMDFPLLLDMLNIYPDIVFNIWGPLSMDFPKHKRLIYHGVIEHDQIEEAISDMECMIMPFIVNDIVKAVDPVKLYEYISFGKNIISVSYPEVERFEPYAWMYKDKKELSMILNRMMDGDLPRKYTDIDKELFVRMNSWDERGENAFMTLEQYSATHL